MTATRAPVTVWLVRHGEVASHRGDVALTEAGVRGAEAAGERLAAALEPDAVVELRHAPTRRTLETLQAIRRGLERALGPGTGVALGEPRVEPAIRNPDLYVAGVRVEMVSSAEALAAQLPPGLAAAVELARHDFFARFWAGPDRIGVWLEDDDPPGERRAEVARRLLAYARSLADVAGPRPRHHVCVTHSGPLRAVLREYVLGVDPGEPEYAEALRVRFDAGSAPAWRFRDVAVH